MTQKDRIGIYLQAGNSLTPLEALDMFGCMRLAAVIHSLKEEGRSIETESVTRNRKTFARYRLKPFAAPAKPQPAPPTGLFAETQHGGEVYFQ